MRTIYASVNDGDTNTSTSGDAPCTINSIIGNPILAVANLVGVGHGHWRNERDGHKQGDQQSASPQHSPR
ncbi:unannotated protein [freshwater metagenome]|uniref:Unannotated protein n=1 Tax=freshwater metagenome TaxID=449393 RepID=A0A6J6F6H0_9ZZZZ